MSLSVSSSPGHGSSSGDGVRRYSPIPYRRGSFDYEPSVLCQCGRKAVLWISWSDDNPGRRYFKCYNARSGGCDFMGWYEGPVDVFIHGLLIDLRDTVWALKRERMELKAALEEQKKEIDALTVQNEALKAVNKGSVLKSVMKRVLLFGLVVPIAASATVFMRLG